jgi:chloramphenicol 3-O-phosphotransferase
VFGVEPGRGMALLFDRLARPYDPEKVTAALLGQSSRVARQLVGAVLATSDETEHLLDAMPTIVRSMAIATTDRAERCMGELRGPVLWAETMSARSASAGDPGLFVCATTTKAYDTDENRVLKAALHAVQQAAHHAEHGMDVHTDDVVKRARHNGQHAARLLEHQTLTQVPVVRPTGRALRRTRAGSRRHTYRPALAVLRRAAEPMAPDHLDAFADARTREQHDLLAATIERVEAATGTRLVLRSDRGGLAGGPLTYHHPGHRDEGHHLDGITIDGVLVDVPSSPAADLAAERAALEQRAGGRPSVLATSAADVSAAVQLALP